MVQKKSPAPGRFSEKHGKFKIYEFKNIDLLVIYLYANWDFKYKFKFYFKF